MKWIIGLGNPGPQYEGTRHNVGVDVVRRLAPSATAGWRLSENREFRFTWLNAARDTVLVQPVTMPMNDSGRCLRGLAAQWKTPPPREHLLIVCDDVNLPLGRLRLRPSGSAGGHHGLQSCADALGTDDVARLRVGVGGGEPGRDLAAFVLAPFTDEERPVVNEMIERAAEACRVWTEAGVERAMNMYNAE